MGNTRPGHARLHRITKLAVAGQAQSLSQALSQSSAVLIVYLRAALPNWPLHSAAVFAFPSGHDSPVPQTQLALPMLCPAH